MRKRKRKNIMAILKIRGKAASIGHIKDYLEKNDRAVKISLFNVGDEENWAEDMQLVKSINGQEDGVQFYHLIQNFEKQEDNPHYTVKEISACGKELAQKIADKGFQVVVVTHTDSGLIHNHIIVNSVNFETGRKVRFSTAKKEQQKGTHVDFYNQKLYDLNDEICKKHGLRTLTESKKLKDEKMKKAGLQPENRKSDENYLEAKKTSYKERMRQSLQEIWQDDTILDPENFRSKLQKKGLTISRKTSTGNITYQDTEGHKVRGKSLGDFNGVDIMQMIQRNRQLQKAKEEKARQQEMERAERERKERINRHNRNRGGGMER